MTGYLASIGAKARLWTTMSELDYIQTIGQHSPLTVGDDRRALLRNYRAAALRRADWGDIKSNIVLREVDRLLTRAALAAELEGAP